MVSRTVNTCVLVLLALFVSATMADLSVLNGLNLSSKDGKLLVPAMIEVFKSIQDSFTNMFDTFKHEFKSMIKEKDTKIDALTLKVSVLEKTVERLEERLDDNDTYERRDTLILSGRKVPVVQPNENPTNILCTLLKDNLNYSVNSNEISVCHRLGAKSASQKPDRRSLIVKFCRRDTKVDVLSSARKGKPSDLFINECLTPCQQTISYVLRKAKKEFPNIISGTTTFEGKNFVWVKPPNPDARGAKDLRLKISTHQKLVDFCTKTLRKPLDHFVSEWTH